MDVEVALFDFADLEPPKPEPEPFTITECPRCGDPVTNQYLFRLNHTDMRERGCSRQWTLSSHTHAMGLALDGKWEHGPITNCHATSHNHGGNSYFAKGAPVLCAATEYAEKRAWLVASGRPDLVYELTTEFARREVEAAANSLAA